MDRRLCGERASAYLRTKGKYRLTGEIALRYLISVTTIPLSDAIHDGLHRFADRLTKGGVSVGNQQAPG